MRRTVTLRLAVLCGSFACALAAGAAVVDAQPQPQPHPLAEPGHVHVHAHGRHSSAGWRDDDPSFPSREEDRQERSFTLRGGKGKVVVDDVAGDVDVRAVDGDTVRVSVRRLAHAQTAADLTRARQEMPLELGQRGDVVTAFVEAPFRSPDGGFDFDDGDVPYRVAYDFTVEVPRDAEVELRTVLDGTIRARGLGAAYRVRNVNGSVTMEEIAGSGSATTVNGELHVAFRKNPTHDCDFGNVNGVVDVTFQPGLAADVRYHTLNGEAWSDFPFTLVPAVPQVSEDRARGRYKVRGDWQEGIRIGAGGPSLSFGTINGNIYLRQRGSAAGR
jgi:hypothetical protein